MAFVGGYDVDIFVSYSLRNDRLRLGGDPWVQRLVKELETQLQNLLPGEDEIGIFYAGRGDLKYGEPVAKCVDMAKKSAIFLIIGSPRYLASWPTRELGAFTSTSGGDSRVFLAELLPLRKGQAYPITIDDPLRLEFHSRTVRGSAQPFEQTVGEFNVRLIDLANNMAERLETLREIGRRSTTSRPANPNFRCVLIARATDDLQARNEELATYLEQFDVPVLLADPDMESQEFRTEFEALLDRAAVVVQLLGPSRTPRPATMPEGFDGFQSAAALVHKSSQLLQWRDLGTDLETIVDAQHHALLSGPRVAEMGFEDFKKLVVTRATEPAPQPPPPPGSSYVFIDADKIDALRARQIFERGKNKNRAVMLRNFDSDEPKDLRANYLSCDRVAVVHEKSQGSWLNSQLQLFLRLQAKRKLQTAWYVDLCPAPPKTGDDLAVAYHRLEVVESADGSIDELCEKLFP
ncbi:MAG: hypothetical protein E7812_12545 [Phenylobacterium sp.]|nr:MAG: hypothetical protein E7812_12545 [Phenylobacterium sp.]